MAESEELKALSFVRRSLLRKNEKLRELTKKVTFLEGEVDRLKTFQWKCADQEKEIETLRADLEVYSSRTEDANHYMEEEDGTIEDNDSNKFTNFEVKEESEEGATDSAQSEYVQPEIEKIEGSSRGDEMGQIGQSEHEQDFSQDGNLVAGEGNELDEQEGSSNDLVLLQQQYLNDIALQQNADPSNQTNTASRSRISTVQAAGGGGAPQGVTCVLCGKTFKAMWFLERHSKIHTREKPHRCPICPHRCIESHQLKMHVLRRHKTFPMCQCPHCFKTFVYNSELANHLLRCHGIRS